MKTFKLFGNYVKPLLVVVQGVFVTGIGYLVANPHALDDTPLPDSWRSPIAVALGIATAIINSRHGQDIAGRPIVGQRAGDKKLADTPTPGPGDTTVISSPDNPNGVAG